MSAKPVVSSSIIKETITLDDVKKKYLEDEKAVRTLSLPLFGAFASLGVLATIYNQNIIIGCLWFAFFLGLGVFRFISACKNIKNFQHIKLYFHKRKLLKKPSVASNVDEPDEYVYQFEGYGIYRESSASQGFHDAEAGDAYLLVCSKENKDIIQLYSLKHFEIAEDVIALLD